MENNTTISLKEMQIKATMRYYFPPTRMVNMKTPPNVGKHVEPPELSYTVGGNVKWSKRFEKQLDSFFKC